MLLGAGTRLAATSILQSAPWVDALDRLADDVGAMRAAHVGNVEVMDHGSLRWCKSLLCMSVAAIAACPVATPIRLSAPTPSPAA